MPEDKQAILGDRPTSTWLNWTPEHVKMWDEWVAERPQCIQDMIAKYNLRLDRLYRLKTTGQRVTLYSLSEAGTVTVNIEERFNSHCMLPLGALLDRSVFGINPADLEETEWEGSLQELEILDTHFL